MHILRRWETTTTRWLRDTHIIDEQRRDDRSEDGAREGGQRLKQLLLMEASLGRLLDLGDLAEEERDSLTRMNRLIQEQSTRKLNQVHLE